jgi:hypothetical protein
MNYNSEQQLHTCHDVEDETKKGLLSKVGSCV